jgi:hypothetical protein
MMMMSLFLTASPSSALNDDKLTANTSLQQNVSISVAGASVREIVAQLNGKDRVPLSFIEDDQTRTLTLVSASVTVRALLEQIAVQTGSYRFEVVKDRLVLLPDDPKYKLEVGDIGIEKEPRIAAVQAYVRALKQRYPSLFGTFLAMPLLGDPRSPTFTDHVTLSRSGTVLEHLVELLGENPRIVFLIVHSKSGAPILTFGEIPEK